MTTPLATDAQGRLLVDVRGPRFGAAVTSLVLAVGLIVQGGPGITLVAWQWFVFAVATFLGLRASIYGNLFRWVKRRFDLGAPPATEPEAAPRFAQLCGFVVTSVALVLFAVGATTAGWIAVGLVLALSALLASTGICIGCGLYVVGQRFIRRS